MNEPGWIVGCVLMGMVLGALFVGALFMALHRRVVELEARTKHLPERDEWNAMRRDITDVSGAVRSIETKLEGVDRLVNLLVESELK
jgi:hypothetical protein